MKTIVTLSEIKIRENKEMEFFIRVQHGKSVTFSLYRFNEKGEDISLDVVRKEERLENLPKDIKILMRHTFRSLESWLLDEQKVINTENVSRETILQNKK